MSDACISDRSDLEVAFIVDQSLDRKVNLYSGIESKLDAHNPKGEKLIKRTKTLPEVLAEFDMPRYIDFLSIDTEGSELDILRGLFPRSTNKRRRGRCKYKFGIITVEHNGKEPRRTQMRQILVGNGYSFAGELHWDDVYLCAELQLDIPDSMGLTKFILDSVPKMQWARETTEWRRTDGR